MIQRISEERIRRFEDDTLRLPEMPRILPIAPDASGWMQQFA